MKTLDVDTKEALPVHLILGASEIARIKTDQAPCVGSPGEPVAELTRFGWTIMSPGKEPDLSNLLVTQTSRVEYEDLCRLDVLGLQDPAVGDQEQASSFILYNFPSTNTSTSYFCLRSYTWREVV